MAGERPIREPDPRLVDAVAARLCWAEWADQGARADTPAEYWATLSNAAKERYRPDGQILASAMTTDRLYAVVLNEANDEMALAAMDAGRGIRSLAGAQHVWRDMVAAARHALGWRSPRPQPPGYP